MTVELLGEVVLAVAALALAGIGVAVHRVATRGVTWRP